MRSVTIILLLFMSAASSAQDLVDTTYQVEITATGCPVISFFRHPRVPGTVNKASLGYGAYLRGMWHPGRLLSVGVITGYLLLAKDDISPGSSGSQPAKYHARLTAIPMQAAITMQKRGLEVGIGIGPYLVLSSIEGGQSASAGGWRIELGMTYFGSYTFLLDGGIRIGPELRILYLPYRGILSLMPSCSVRFDVMRY